MPGEHPAVVQCHYCRETRGKLMNPCQVREAISVLPNAVNIYDIGISNDFRQASEPRSVQTLDSHFFQAVGNAEQSRYRSSSLNLDDAGFIELFIADKEPTVVSLRP